MGEVAAEVGERALEAEVEDDVDERGAQSRLQRVVASIRRRNRVDVLGRDRGADEDESVVEIDAVQDLHEHRVEERLRAFRLLVVDQQADELELDLLPQRVAIEPRGPEFALDALGGLQHAAIVEIDAVAADVLDGEPVAGLEVAARGARAFAEQRVVLVEALDQRHRDRLRGGRGGRRARGKRRRGGRHRGVAGPDADPATASASRAGR